MALRLRIILFLCFGLVAVAGQAMACISHTQEAFLPPAVDLYSPMSRLPQRSFWQQAGPVLSQTRHHHTTAVGNLPHPQSIKQPALLAQTPEKVQYGGLSANGEKTCPCCDDCQCGQCQSRCGCVVHVAIAAAAISYWPFRNYHYDSGLESPLLHELAFPVHSPPD